MCRHLAYLGPPVTVAELLLEPEHSLLQQSWAPADMRGGGSVNADGFGFGWYDGPGPGSESGSGSGPGTGPDSHARRYRRAVPMWADASLPDLAATIRTGALLAATRNGTVGMPVLENACAPYREGRWLFSHNGVVAGWPEAVADLAARLPTIDLMQLEAPTDSALLWALLRHRLRAGADLAEAVEELTLSVAEHAPDSRLNLLATDGETVVATAWTHSLAVRHRDDAVTVASEPFGPAEGWEPVPDKTLVVATTTGVKQHPMTDSKGAR